MYLEGFLNDYSDECVTLFREMLQAETEHHNSTGFLWHNLASLWVVMKKLRPTAAAELMRECMRIVPSFELDPFVRELPSLSVEERQAIILSLRLRLKEDQSALLKRALEVAESGL